MAKRSTDFWRVGAIVDLFTKNGCQLRIAEATVQLPDGDCFNARYLYNPKNDAFVPLIDLMDEDSVSEAEVSFWERRLGLQIGRPDK